MKNKEKVLVIRFSSIGDIVLTTSFLNSVKKSNDNVEIHYLTLDKFSSILELQPDIDRLIILNSNSPAKDLFKMNGYIHSLKYDRIYDLHGSIRSRIITFGLNKITTRVKKPRFLRFMLFQFLLLRRNRKVIACFDRCLLYIFLIPVVEVHVARIAAVVAEVAPPLLPTAAVTAPPPPPTTLAPSQHRLQHKSKTYQLSM